MGLIRPLCAICFRGAQVARAAVPVVPGPFIHSFTGHGGSRGSAVVTVTVPKEDGRRGLSLSSSSLFQVQVYFSHFNSI